MKYVAYVCALDRCSCLFITLQKIFTKKFHSISSRVKISCSGKVQLYLIWTWGVPFRSVRTIKGGGGPSNTTVIILTMMLEVILGLHVSILLNHLQALLTSLLILLLLCLTELHLLLSVIFNPTVPMYTNRENIVKCKAFLIRMKMWMCMVRLSGQLPPSCTLSTSQLWIS